VGAVDPTGHRRAHSPTPEAVTLQKFPRKPVQSVQLAPHDVSVCRGARHSLVQSPAEQERSPHEYVQLPHDCGFVIKSRQLPLQFAKPEGQVDWHPEGVQTSLDGQTLLQVPQ
jgi:hypothetical protein